jgi:ferric-dicitrate binding protein FerR (iron transport regulator)
MDDIRQQLNKVIETATRHATRPEPAELRRRLRRRRQRGTAATVTLLLGAGIGLPNLLGSVGTFGRDTHSAGPGQAACLR